MDTTTYTEFHVYRPSPGLVIVFTAASRYQRPPLARDEEGHFPGRPSEPRPCPLEGRFFVPAAEVSRERILEEVAYMSLDWPTNTPSDPNATDDIPLEHQVERVAIDPEQITYMDSDDSMVGVLIVRPAPIPLPASALVAAADRVDAESELATPVDASTARRWLDGEHPDYDYLEMCARIARLWSFSVWAEADDGAAVPIAGPFVLCDPPPAGTPPPTHCLTSLRWRLAKGEDRDSVLGECSGRQQKALLERLAIREVDRMRFRVERGEDMASVLRDCPSRAATAVYSATHMPLWPGQAVRGDVMTTIDLGLVTPTDPGHTAMQITGKGLVARALGVIGYKTSKAKRERILAFLHSDDEYGIIRRQPKERRPVTLHEIEAWRSEADEVSSAPIETFAGGPSSAAADLLAH